MEQELSTYFKRTKVNKVNQGTYFKLKASNSAPVWVRGGYVRELGKYSCYKYDDTNKEKFLKGDHEIFTDFTF